MLAEVDVPNPDLGLSTGMTAEATVVLQQQKAVLRFVPVMSLEKSRQTESIRIVPLENGPIMRQLSFALLGGPINAGPVRDLIGMLQSFDCGTLEEVPRSAQELPL
jgi:hypothetical protein